MKKWIAIAALLLALAGGAGCARRAPSSAKARDYISITRAQMGTIVTIKIPPNKAPAAEKAFAEIARLENLLSKYKPDSDVSRIKAHAGEGLVRVSPDTLKVVRASLQVFRDSGGAFDITVGPLLDLWKKCKKEQRIPSETEIAEARKRVGSDKIIVKDHPPRIGLAAKGMEIDLGAIAKGYAVDRAVSVLCENGVKSAIVNAGGDIRVLGDKRGAPWRIGIQDPRVPDQPKVIETLHLKNWAVATSGNYRRFYQIKGRRYSHIIDPRTGKPANAADSVTALAPDAMTADAWATAVSVLGAKEGIKTVDAEPNVECMMIHVVKGELFRTASSGFDKFVSSRIDYANDPRKSTFHTSVKN